MDTAHTNWSQRRSLCPERIWKLSTAQHDKGRQLLASLLKSANYLIFRCILPPQALVGANLRLGHFGLGTVVHMNTRIGNDVLIWHGVSVIVRSDLSIEPQRFVHVGDRVEIGAHAIIIGPPDRDLFIGDDSVIGAGAIVTKDVPPKSIVVGENRILREIEN